MPSLLMSNSARLQVERPEACLTFKTGGHVAGGQVACFERPGGKGKSAPLGKGTSRSRLSLSSDDGTRAMLVT